MDLQTLPGSATYIFPHREDPTLGATLFLNAAPSLQRNVLLMGTTLFPYPSQRLQVCLCLPARRTSVNKDTVIGLYRAIWGNAK